MVDLLLSYFSCIIYVFVFSFSFWKNSSIFCSNSFTDLKTKLAIIVLIPKSQTILFDYSILITYCLCFMSIVFSLISLKMNITVPLQFSSALCFSQFLIFHALLFWCFYFMLGAFFKCLVILPVCSHLTVKL